MTRRYRLHFLEDATYLKLFHPLRALLGILCSSLGTCQVPLFRLPLPGDSSPSLEVIQMSFTSSQPSQAPWETSLLKISQVIFLSCFIFLLGIYHQLRILEYYLSRSLVYCWIISSMKMSLKAHASSVKMAMSLPTSRKVIGYQ